jgi:hypothetical protein
VVDVRVMFIMVRKENADGDRFEWPPGKKDLYSSRIGYQRYALFLRAAKPVKEV